MLCSHTGGTHGLETMVPSILQTHYWLLNAVFSDKYLLKLILIGFYRPAAIIYCSLSDYCDFQQSDIMLLCFIYH